MRTPYAACRHTKADHKCAYSVLLEIIMWSLLVYYIVVFVAFA